MSRRFRICQSVAILAAAVVFAQTSVGEDVTFDSHVKPFLATYCVACHGLMKQKGDRRFDQLTGEIADDNGLVDLQDMLDQLNLGEMPPKEARQPTDDQRQRIIGWMTARIEQYRRERKPAAVQ